MARKKDEEPNNEEYVDFGEDEMDVAEVKETASESIERAVSSVSLDEKSDDISPETQVTVGQITFDFGNSDDIEMRNRIGSSRDKQTLADARVMNIQSFNSAIRNRWSGRGTVATVTTKSYGDMDMACLTLQAEAGFLILIPYSEVFQTDPIINDVNLSTTAGREDYVRRQIQILEKLMDTQVRFVPTQLFELENGSVGVLASRKLALAEARLRSFKGTRRRPARYKEGDIVEANIVSVGSAIMRIELGGYETSMKKYFLTDYHIEDLKTKYIPGGKIPVLVEKIEDIVDEETWQVKDVNVTLNGFKAEIELDRANLDMIRTDDRMNVRLSKVVKKGDPEAPYFNFIAGGESIRVHAKIERLNTLGTGTPPKIGDLVTIRVRSINKYNDGYVHGYITAIHRGTAKNG